MALRLTAVVFDWAGTLVDHGSRAPIAALQDVFAGAGVPVTTAEARLSMGIAKKDHIRAILGLSRVAAAWKELRGADPGEADVELLYAEFLPKQLTCLGSYSKLIDGVTDVAGTLKSRGVKIGSTTGYTRPMLDFLLMRARDQGFVPDCAVSPEDVPGGGRPGPWMCYLNAIRLEVGPMWSTIKIGDTPSDIEEGQNAGMWTVGVTRTGNEAGLTEGEWTAATPAQRGEIVAGAEKRLVAAGAHYLVESVGNAMDVIERISVRIANGDRP
jgi:phosphonoacetaldehyde hydrolase